MKANRPRLHLPMSMMEWVLQAMTLSLLCATVFIVYFYWSILPEQIVTHFNASGAPDHYGPKSTLWMLCGTSVFNFLLMTLLSRFPHTFNYLKPITESNAASQYLLARKFIFVMNLEVTGIMFFAIWSCIQVTLGAAKSLDLVSMLTLLVAILISTAIYMFRASRA
jgi:uncharacterized membrane protein